MPTLGVTGSQAKSVCSYHWHCNPHTPPRHTTFCRISAQLELHPKASLVHRIACVLVEDFSLCRRTRDGKRLELMLTLLR